MFPYLPNSFNAPLNPPLTPCRLCGIPNAVTYFGYCFDCLRPAGAATASKASEATMFRKAKDDPEPQAYICSLCQRPTGVPCVGIAMILPETREIKGIIKHYCSLCWSKTSFKDYPIYPLEYINAEE
jgi:hypothetical protein